VSTPAQFAYADTPGDGRRGDRRPDRGLSDRISRCIHDERRRVVRVPRLPARPTTTTTAAGYGPITTVGVTFVRTTATCARESFERIVEAIADAVDAPLRFDDHAENTPGQS